MIREGGKAQYVGENPDIPMGSVGRVLSWSPQELRAHVLWMTGARQNQVDYVDAEDLLSLGGGAEDPQLRVAVRDEAIMNGVDGLYSTLVESGHFSHLAAVVEETKDRLVDRIRSDPGMAEVLGQLDSEDGEELLALFTESVLRDALTEG